MWVCVEDDRHDLWLNVSAMRRCVVGVTGMMKLNVSALWRCVVGVSRMICG